MHYNNSYNALNAPHYQRVGENCEHGQTKTLEQNTPNNSLFLFYINALEKPLEQNSHSYKDVHGKTKQGWSFDKDVHHKNPHKIWIVIRTWMFKINTHTRIIWIVIHPKTCMKKTNKNMDSHQYKDVHNKNPYKNNMDSHSYKVLHDKNPY